MIYPFLVKAKDEAHSVISCTFITKNLEDSEKVLNFALNQIKEVMSEEYKDLENGYMASEPSQAEMPLTELKEVDYSFGNRNFGYPHTLEELDAALDNADGQRHDPSQWLSSIEFHNRLESKYSWLR